MKTDVTAVMVEEHKLILRMVALVDEKIGQLEAGRPAEWRFFLDAVDFIRHYADRFHHAKEEDVLFTALVENGMPAKSSPIEAMHLAHDQGRAFVRGMEAAAQRALAGEPGQEAAVIENGRGYIAMIRDHIDKEDTILYPLAERVLPEALRPEMVAAYRRAEEQSIGLEEKYRRMVEGWEAGSAA